MMGGLPTQNFDAEFCRPKYMSVLYCNGKDALIIQFTGTVTEHLYMNEKIPANGHTLVTAVQYRVWYNTCTRILDLNRGGMHCILPVSIQIVDPGTCIAKRQSAHYALSLFQSSTSCIRILHIRSWKVRLAQGNPGFPKGTN